MILSGAVYRHEARLLLLNPATPVFLAFAWAVEGFLTFYAAPLLHLSVTPGPLAYVPMIFCLLLPLMTMGMADDERNGRLERLLTLPISRDAIWFTRFVLHALVAGIFLLGTWPLVASAAWVGPVDWQAVALGYGVVFGVGVLQLALTFWIPAETGHAMVAFLCGFLLNTVLVVAGWGLLRPWLGFFAAGPVPDGLLGDGLALANMLAMPLITAIFYLFYRRRRRLRAQK